MKVWVQRLRILFACVMVVLLALLMSGCGTSYELGVRTQCIKEDKRFTCEVSHWPTGRVLAYCDTVEECRDKCNKYEKLGVE